MDGAYIGAGLTWIAATIALLAMVRAAAVPEPPSEKKPPADGEAKE